QGRKAIGEGWLNPEHKTREVAGLGPERILPEGHGEAGWVGDGSGEAGSERWEHHLTSRVDPASHEIAESALRQIVGPEAAGREALHLLLPLDLQRAGREQAALGELPLPLFRRHHATFGNE